MVEFQHAKRGAMASIYGIVVGFPVEHPLHVCKTVSQLKPGLAAGAVIRDVIARRGIAGLYDGGFPHAAKMLGRDFLRWYTISWLKRRMKNGCLKR